MPLAADGGAGNTSRGTDCRWDSGEIVLRLLATSLLVVVPIVVVAAVVAVVRGGDDVEVLPNASTTGGRVGEEEDKVVEDKVVGVRWTSVRCEPDLSGAAISASCCERGSRGGIGIRFGLRGTAPSRKCDLASLAAFSAILVADAFALAAVSLIGSFDSLAPAAPGSAPTATGFFTMAALSATHSSARRPKNS